MKTLFNSIKILGTLGIFFSIYWWFTDYFEGLLILFSSAVIFGVGILMEWSEKSIEESF